MNRDIKIPKKADQMQFDFLGIPLGFDSPLLRARVVRDQTLMPRSESLS
jgi:hypothetical protein